MFFVPGYIISALRRLFVIGREVNGHEYLLKILSYSLVNYAIFSWPVYIIVTGDSSALINGFLWFLVLCVGPIIIGTVWGISIQMDWGYSVLRKCKINPIHVISTAWDWKFSRMNSGSFVLVTLKDDTKYAGWCAASSFMSSDPAERDVYIEKMYNFEKDGKQWEDRGNDSVLICAGEIKTIEFIDSDNNEEDDNVER